MHNYHPRQCAQHQHDRPDPATPSHSHVLPPKQDWRPEARPHPGVILATAATAPGSGRPDPDTGDPQPLSYRPVIEAADPRHVHGPRQPPVEEPQVIALVQLEEGPRMMTNVVGVEPLPANLLRGLQLQVAFEQRGDHAIPVFTPAEAAR